MVIEDSRLVKSYMDGEEYEAAEFAHTLRMDIWKEIFGLSEKELLDPLSDDLWFEMQKITSVKVQAI